MAFTFNNYATSELSKNPLNDIISNLFGGYEQGVKASYLQPSLAEELKKSQLYNKWYEPNMQSEIGLRGAHAGLLGEQTRTAHTTNEFLPQRLKSELEAQQLAAAQSRMFNDMLRKKLSGEQSQPNNQMNMSIPNQEYNPGQGMAPYDNQSQSPFSQPQNESQFQRPDVMQDALTQAFQQQPTADDFFNKKLFGIDTFTPKMKALIDLQTKGMQTKQAEQYKLEAKQSFEDYKTSSQAQQDVPKINDALQAAYRMKDIIQNRPAFFGHWVAPGIFAKRATDQLAGEFQGELVPQIVGVEKQLSERGNQLALKISENKVPGFADSQAVALGKVNALINELTKSLYRSKDLAGGNIVRRGNKRFKFVDGHWYELKKGDY